MEEKSSEPKKQVNLLALLSQLFQKKNRLFLLGIAGILLIFLSDMLFQPRNESKQTLQTAHSATDAVSYVQDLEQRLTQMIVNVQGAGKTVVMITLDSSGETVYARNEKNDTETQSADSGVQTRKSSYESEYTIVDSGGADSPIVEAQLLPEIKGVAVICEGAEDITVVSRVTELVSVVLGLSTNRICVTKMI